MVTSAVKPGYKVGRGDDGMTSRERQVLYLLREGHSNGEIGRRLDLSKQRVGQIVRSMVEKGVIKTEDGRTYVEVVPMVVTP